MAYNPPDWCGLPSEPGNVRLMASRKGAVVRMIKINTQKCYVVGREPGTDITLKHPSISRKHAVLLHVQARDALWSLRFERMG